ncbi:hypothetical protein IV203_029643 [Nitzschia inconspicua]|uniref:Uncharacterized protein n=1 Tax=Nitzschia inconspicua TaxID=303405 RepID=A0A9K3Q0X9_9STRA|nr:hypothetical protein IV203_029643 [Nitzschia inconspicua]
MGSLDHRPPSSETPRRSIFPSSYGKKESRKKKNLNVSFSPYARQKQVDSVKDMSEVDKSNLWWQKADYDDFTRISRIISKAMLEGGSEVWLMSKPSTANNGSVTTTLTTVVAPEAEVATKHLIEASASREAPQNRDLKALQAFHETRSQWWHKFGHTRRGLEHLASSGEGKQRHGSVRASIRAVLEEQKRQEMFLPAGYRDVNKIRSLYVQQTHWAKALARAMGEFDAEEVRCKFDINKRRPREFFLRTYLTKDAREAENLPVFMQTVLAISAHKLDLDAHTASQICFRNTARSMDSSTQLKRRDSFSDITTAREPPILLSEDLPEEKKCESDDVIVTPKSQEMSPTNLAKQAAGFLGEETKHQDQLKILTGMGSPANIVG